MFNSEGGCGGCRRCGGAGLVFMVVYFSNIECGWSWLQLDSACELALSCGMAVEEGHWLISINI